MLLRHCCWCGPGFRVLQHHLLHLRTIVLDTVNIHSCYLNALLISLTVISLCVCYTRTPTRPSHRSSFYLLQFLGVACVSSYPYYVGVRFVMPFSTIKMILILILILTISHSFYCRWNYFSHNERSETIFLQFLNKKTHITITYKLLPAPLFDHNMYRNMAFNPQTTFLSVNTWCRLLSIRRKWRQ